ncbi:MAG: hypothetical protein K5790_03150 [Nitrosopumilus sp.]|uniref:hypothetical protein n=1 Tax=Nitrosopumilus sp. TaxID=2024843 RepID=UPI00247EE844|nr:hypothetical protein [Nitrosopumilus sp.]MCV0392274.1 hypothetical protein [Nitrosopumilus sp.]
MTDFSLEDVEFIKLLAHSDSANLLAEIDESTKKRLDNHIAVILREYYYENTLNAKTNWNEKFLKAGIAENDGKAAIACARRMGIDIF